MSRDARGVSGMTRTGLRPVPQNMRQPVVLGSVQLRIRAIGGPRQKLSSCRRAFVGENSWQASISGTCSTLAAQLAAAWSMRVSSRQVMGLYPGDPGPPGADCAGTVLELSERVEHLRQIAAVVSQDGRLEHTWKAGRGRLWRGSGVPEQILLGTRAARSALAPPTVSCCCSLALGRWWHPNHPAGPSKRPGPC